HYFFGPVQLSPQARRGVFAVACTFPFVWWRKSLHGLADWALLNAVVKHGLTSGKHVEPYGTAVVMTSKLNVLKGQCRAVVSERQRARVRWRRSPRAGGGSNAPSTRLLSLTNDIWCVR